MEITLIITTLLMLVMLIESVLGIYLAYSDYLPGNTRLGWILLGIFAAAYIAFTFGWLGRMPGFFLPPLMLFCMVIFPVLQIPLVTKLIPLSIIPNPSKGLKVIKVHTEAEKLVVQDDLPGAIKEYEKIVSEDSEDLEARFRLAELCSENKEYEKAAAAYEAVLKSGSELGISQHCSVLTRLSELYARHLGEVEQARRLIEKIIKDHPDTKYARYARDRLSNL